MDTSKRPRFITCRAGFDAQGAPVAWKHTKAGSFHNISALAPKEVRDAAWYQDWSWGAYEVPYAFPAIETAYVTVDLPVKHGPWRAVFAPSSVFAREAFFDEMAHARNADPLAFRLDLLKGADIVKAGRVTIDRRRLRRVLEVVREKSGWGAPVPKGHGRGVACNAYFGHTYIAYVVDLRVNGDGHAHIERVVAAVDCGIVVNPIGVEQQIEGGIIWAFRLRSAAKSLSAVAPHSKAVTPTSPSRECATRPQSKRTLSRATVPSRSAWANPRSRRSYRQSRTPFSRQPGNASVAYRSIPKIWREIKPEYPIKDFAD